MMIAVKTSNHLNNMHFKVKSDIELEMHRFLDSGGRGLILVGRKNNDMITFFNEVITEKEQEILHTIFIDMIK